MRRGEIWLINLDPTVGAEIKKSRPGVIISSDAIGILPLRVIVPLTDWKDHYRQSAWMVKIVPKAENGLSKDSAADTAQVRSVSTSRFIQKLGAVNQDEMDEIVNALGLVVEYPPVE
jgi:mRNA interferase MazF